MPDTPGQAWRCTVCGYVHRGEAAPDTCPVCGASREAFEPHVEQPPAKPAATADTWRCINCGYIHTGSAPTGPCPVCGAPADRFEPVEETAPQAPQEGAGPRIVIVGAGIAGISAVESIRSTAPNAQVTLISKDAELPYYRLNLTRYVADEIGEDDLWIHPESWYGENQVDLRRGQEAAAVYPDDYSVEIRGGERLEYDKLILTAGAHPFVPPFPGSTRDGVLRFRTVDDARRIIEAARSGAKIVCVGGGILGLETAGGLARRGADVSLLEGHGWLLPRQLCQSASPLLEQHIASLGVKLHKQVRVDEILGDECVREVRLKNGDVLPADFVVISTGVRPNSHLARSAGLDVQKGILVDNFLRTSQPDIFAAGDLAEHQGVLYGLWTPAQYQGSIAGLNAAGSESEFGGIPRSTTLKVLGMDMVSIGQFEPVDASYLCLEDDADGRYRRFVFRDHQLIGAILIGDTSLTASVKSAIEEGADLSKLVDGDPSPQDVASYMAERT